MLNLIIFSLILSGPTKLGTEQVAQAEYQLADISVTNHTSEHVCYSWTVDNIGNVVTNNKYDWDTLTVHTYLSTNDPSINCDGDDIDDIRDCETDSDCAGDWICVGIGICVPPAKDVDSECTKDKPQGGIKLIANIPTDPIEIVPWSILSGSFCTPTAINYNRDSDMWLRVVLKGSNVALRTPLDIKFNYSPKSCCLNHPDKPTSPLTISNYDCSILDPFGQDRCNKVYGGNICKWTGSKLCNKQECKRVSKYELHYEKYIDVGVCSGLCKDDNKSCNPGSYSTTQIGYNKINIIEECICDSCSVEPVSTHLEISVDRCKGDCNSDQTDKVCNAGIDDNFINSNGAEPSNPSIAMISGILSGCSAGIQSGFDIFADNKCFGHTFTNCFSQGECPLRSANLRICMQAADVYLTNTDSLVLGINGGGLWGLGLPALNGGTWNRNEKMCLDLNLANLPGSGANILLDIQMAGHLDVMVQDDTAVDFVTLSIQYEQCHKCIPKISSISHLYSGGKVTDYIKADDCDCVDIDGCKKYDHFITYYEGTIFENTVNVGQCFGKCTKYLRCAPIYRKKLLKAPEGTRTINIVKKCSCSKLTWNPHGLYNLEKI